MEMLIPLDVGCYYLIFRNARGTFESRSTGGVGLLPFAFRNAPPLLFNDIPMTIYASVTTDQLRVELTVV